MYACVCLDITSFHVVLSNSFFNFFYLVVEPWLLVRSMCQVFIYFKNNIVNYYLSSVIIIISPTRSLMIYNCCETNLRKDDVFSLWNILLSFLFSWGIGIFRYKPLKQIPWLQNFSKDSQRARWSTHLSSSSLSTLLSWRRLWTSLEPRHAAAEPPEYNNKSRSSWHK